MWFEKKNEGLAWFAYTNHAICGVVYGMGGVDASWQLE